MEENEDIKNNIDKNIKIVIKDYEEKIENLEKINFEYKIKLLEKDLHYTKEILEIREEEIKVLKEDNKDNKNIINKTIQYIMDKYPNAKPMHPIPDDICLKYHNSNDLGNDLIRCYEMGILYKRLGKIFIKEYKTEPENQSLWVTDVSRYNYVLNIEENNICKWIVDKNAVKLTEKYIQIFLNKIDEIIKEKNNQICDLLTEDNITSMFEKIKICKQISSDIYNGIASEKLIKEISPDFALNK